MNPSKEPLALRRQWLSLIIITHTSIYTTDTYQQTSQFISPAITAHSATIKKYTASVKNL